MAISGREKLRLTGELRKLQKQIRNPDTKGAAKVRLSREYKSIRSQIVAGSQRKQPSRLENLLSGKYSNQDAVPFISIIRQIVNEDGVSLGEVRPAAKGYIENAISRKKLAA